MRIAIGFALLAVVTAASVAPADEPRLGPAFADGIARQLLSADAKERAAGEAALEKATPELLKTLVLRMRDRDSAAPKPILEPRLPEKPQVFVETILLTPTTRDVARWGLSCGGSPRRLSVAEAQAFQTEVARGGRIVTSPKILALAGDEASMWIGEETSYVSGFDFAILAKRTVGDPVVETLATGFEMRIKPTVATGGQWIELVLDVGQSALAGLRAEDLPLPGTDRSVKVQRPDVVSRRWQTRAGLRSGESLLLLAPEGYSEDGSPRALLLSARVLQSGK